LQPLQLLDARGRGGAARASSAQPERDAPSAPIAPGCAVLRHDLGAEAPSPASLVVLIVLLFFVFLVLLLLLVLLVLLILLVLLVLLLVFQLLQRRSPVGCRRPRACGRPAPTP